MKEFPFHNGWNTIVFMISMNYVMFFNLIHDQLRLLITLMPTMNAKNAFQLSSQCLSSLTYNYFNKFWQEDMIRMTKVPTTQTSSTTKPLLSHTSRIKTRPVFLSQPVDIFDEPNCYSTKAILLEKDEHHLQL